MRSKTTYSKLLAVSPMSRRSEAFWYQEPVEPIASMRMMTYRMRARNRRSLKRKSKTAQLLRIATSDQRSTMISSISQMTVQALQIRMMVKMKMRAWLR